MVDGQGVGEWRAGSVVRACVCVRAPACSCGRHAPLAEVWARAACRAHPGANAKAAILRQGLEEMRQFAKVRPCACVHACAPVGWHSACQGVWISATLRDARLFTLSQMISPTVRDDTFLAACGVADVIASCYGAPWPLHARPRKHPACRTPQQPVGPRCTPLWCCGKGGSVAAVVAQVGATGAWRRSGQSGG